MAETTATHTSSTGTATPAEPPVTIPPITEISDLPKLKGAKKEDLDGKQPTAVAAYDVATVTADQAFGKAFDKAKSDLVKAQGAYTAAQQTYALAVATYNSALQTARATQESAYEAAVTTLDKTC